MNNAVVTAKVQAPIERKDNDGFVALMCRACAYVGENTMLNRLKNFERIPAACGVVIDLQCRKCGQKHEYRAPAKMTG